MIALVVNTKNEIRRVEYDPPHYDVIKEAVGGRYEHVHPMGLEQPYSMMVNEEGLLLGLPMNRLGSELYGTPRHGQPIVGDIVFLKDGYDGGEPEVERREDADTTKYYYTVSSRAVSLYRENVETSEDTEAKEEQERQKRELERREAALKKLSADAYALRLDFIKNYSKAKKNLPLIIQFAGLAMCEVTDNVDFEILVNLLDIACDLENEGLDMEAYNIALTERPEYTLLAIAYASVDYERLSYYQKNWRMENGQYGYHLDYEANEALDFLYHRLTDLGYEMSDEEKALQDGTHELFREGEPAAQEDKEAAQDE